MAQQFNLTAQINLQSPKNVGRVVSDIQRQLKGSGLNTVNIKVKADPRSMAQTNKQLQGVSKNSRAAAKDINTLNRSLQEATRRFSVITLATGTLLSFVTGIKNSTKAAIEFERELIKISQVTGKSVQQLQGLTKEVTRLSTAFGVSSADLLNVSRTLAQAGFSAEKTRKALDILAKTTLAATFDNIQDTTEGAIALLRQFGDEAKRSGGDIAFLEKSLSAINSVSKKFAVESGDLITVIRRVGGVFSSAGGSINELIALFTSVRATTRESAETIATGLRTIFTRIQRTDTIDQLKALNIQLQDSKGQFVGAFEAVKRLSQGLAALDPKDFRFSEIVESLGGFRQIGKVIPLIQQFAVAQEALSVAQGASGSVAKDAATAQQGLGVQIQKVKEEFTALIRQFSDSGPFNTIATGALKIASAMIKVAEAVEPLLPLLTTMFGLKLGRALAPGLGQLAGIGRGSRGGGGGFSKFARGGMVPGQGNRDTVPAMLTPGEFVIKKSSVKSLGAGTLAQMNENRFNLGKEIKANLVDKTAARTGQSYTKKELGNIQVLDDLGAAALGAEVEKYAGAFLRPEGANRVSKGTIDAKVMQNAFKRSPKVVAAKKRTGASKLIDNELKEIGAAASSGGRYGFALHAGSLSKTKSDQLEETILGGVGKAIKTGANQVHGTLGRSSKLDAGTLAGIMTSANIDNVVGNIFEGVITALGSQNPYGDRDSNADFDYASGLQGERARIFGLSSVADVPTDAKSTFNGANLKSFLKKVKNYETAKSVEDVLKAVTPALDAMQSQKSQPTDAQQARTQKGQARLAKMRERAGYAKGGSVSDTVPAMLTPGEFVFNKGAAQSIGYGNLKRMNEQGVQGYAAGGVVTTGRNNYGIPAASAQISSGGSATDLIKDAEDEAEARKNSTQEIKKGTGETKKSSESVKKQTGSFSKLKGSVDKFRDNLSKSSERVRSMAGAAQSFVFIGASIGAVTSQMSGLEDSTKRAINETAGFAAGVVGIGATLVDTFYSMAASNAIQEQSSKRVTQANLEQAASGGGDDDGGDVDEAAEGMGKFGKIMTGLAAGLAVGVTALQFFSAKNKAVADELQKDVKSALEGIKTGVAANADEIKASAASEIEARTLSANQVSYSALGTVAAFAAAGATIGTFVPVIGNVVGGIVGGLIGFGVAMFGASAATDAAIAARQKEIQAIYDTIDSIIALNQAQRDLETGIADIDAAKGLEPAEVVKKRLEVQKSGVGAGAEFQIAQGQLNELAKGTGKSAGQLTEEDFEDDAVKLGKFNASSQAAASAMDVLNKRLQITSETFSLAMQNADPTKTFEELSTQAGPYKDALDAQIAAINERTQVEIFNAKQALENAKGTANETAAKEALAKAEERGKTSIDNLREGAEASHKILYAQAEAARIARDASIALAKSLIENGKFFDGLNKQLQSLQRQSMAIDNFAAALDGAAFKFQEINIDEIDNLTNVRDLSTFAQQLGDAAKGAGPEAQKYVDQLTANAAAFKKAQEGGLLGLEQKLTDDAGSGQTEKILKDLGFSAESLGGGELGKVVFEKMQSELKKALEDGVVDASELEAILGPAEEANAQAVDAAKKLVEIRQQEIANLQKTIDVQNKLREKEIQAREAQVDAIRKGVGFTEKAYATLSKSIDPNADFTPQRGVETRLQNINAQNRLDTLGKGLQAGDIGGVTQARRDAQQRQEEIRKEIEAGGLSIEKTKALIAEQDKLRTIINTTGDELKRLSDRTSEAADIQGAMEQNLRAIEKERRAREQVTGVIEEFVVGGQDARKGLVEAAAGVRQAFSSGTLQMQSPEQRSATVGLLDKLSDTMVAGGMTGRQIKQELVFQDAVRLGLDPKLAEAIATGTSTEEKLIEANRNLAKKMEILSVSMLIAAQGLAPAIPFANGGMVQYRAGGGSIFKPRGTDTVPAMLSPGEFVIRKSAVDSIGADALAAINEGGVSAVYASTGMYMGGRGGIGMPTQAYSKKEKDEEEAYNRNLKKQTDDPRSQYAGGVLGDPFIERAAAVASNIGSGGAASLSLSGVDIGAGSTTTGGAKPLNRTRNLDAEAERRDAEAERRLASEFGNVDTFGLQQNFPLDGFETLEEEFIKEKRAEAKAQRPIDLSMAIKQGYKPSFKGTSQQTTDDPILNPTLKPKNADEALSERVSGPKEFLDTKAQQARDAADYRKIQQYNKDKDQFSAMELDVISRMGTDKQKLDAGLITQEEIDNRKPDSTSEFQQYSQTAGLDTRVSTEVTVTGTDFSPIDSVQSEQSVAERRKNQQQAEEKERKSLQQAQTNYYKKQAAKERAGISNISDEYEGRTLESFGPSRGQLTQTDTDVQSNLPINQRVAKDAIRDGRSSFPSAPVTPSAGEGKRELIGIDSKGKKIYANEPQESFNIPGYVRNIETGLYEKVETGVDTGLRTQLPGSGELGVQSASGKPLYASETINNTTDAASRYIIDGTLPQPRIAGQRGGTDPFATDAGPQKYPDAKSGKVLTAQGAAVSAKEAQRRSKREEAKAKRAETEANKQKVGAAAPVAPGTAAGDEMKKQAGESLEEFTARKTRENEFMKSLGMEPGRPTSITTGFTESGEALTVEDYDLDAGGGILDMNPYSSALAGPEAAKKAALKQRRDKRRADIRKRRGILPRGQRGTPAQLARRQQEEGAELDSNNAINKARYERILRTQGPAAAQRFANYSGYEPPKTRFTRGRGRSQQAGASNTDQLLQQLLRQMVNRGSRQRPEGFAAGGSAAGSDVIPAMLTPGEFVMSAGAVRQHGVGTMRALNRGQVPGFNRGGMVGGVAYRANGSNGAEFGGSGISINTANLDESFSNFVGNFSSELDKITGVFSPMAQALQDLAKVFGGSEGIKMNHVHSVTVTAGSAESKLDAQTIDQIGKLAADYVKPLLPDGNDFNVA